MNTTDQVRAVRDSIMTSMAMLRAGYKNQVHSHASEARGKIILALSLGIISTETAGAGDSWIAKVANCRLDESERNTIEEKAAWTTFDNLIRGVK